MCLDPAAVRFKGAMYLALHPHGTNAWGRWVGMSGVAFWSAALDAIEEPLPEQSRHIYRLLRLPDAEIRVLLQRTNNEKVSKERMHLDLETDDIEAEVRRLEALGATRYDHQHLVLPPRPGWRDLAGRYWRADPSRKAPPTKPAPEPSRLGS